MEKSLKLVVLLVALCCMTRCALGEEVSMAATCYNNMRVYFDGVAQSDLNVDNWRDTSTFSVPVATKVVAIDCKAPGELGGILASFSNGLVTDAGWYCSSKSAEKWTTDMFDPTTSTSWAPAVVLGANGMSPWFERPDISLEAQWIWTANKEGEDQIVYCRTVLVQEPEGKSSKVKSSKVKSSKAKSSKVKSSKVKSSKDK